MYKKLITAAVIAVVAAAVAGLASAGGAATHQEIAFSYANNSKMTLTPVTSGSILADRGSTSWCCWSQKTVQRDGEQLDVNNPLATFVGKRGSLTWREQITWVDLTNGYSVATGTWKIVHGSGAYQHLAGHGHLAFIQNASDTTLSFRAVGLVDQG
jgi:hypothetical protein